jgi:hypothetical protein
LTPNYCDLRLSAGAALTIVDPGEKERVVAEAVAFLGSASWLAMLEAVVEPMHRSIQKDALRLTLSAGGVLSIVPVGSCSRSSGTRRSEDLPRALPRIESSRRGGGDLRHRSQPPGLPALQASRQ